MKPPVKTPKAPLLLNWEDNQRWFYGRLPMKKGSQYILPVYVDTEITQTGEFEWDATLYHKKQKLPGVNTCYGRGGWRIKGSIVDTD